MITPIVREFRRILIIKPSSPGDIIHTLPVLHGLRSRYSDAKIDWLVATGYVDLVAVDPALSEAIPFDRARFGRMLRSPRIAWEFFAFVRDLRRRNYDLVIDLQGLFRSGFMARASGAKVRIGFAGAREFAWVFYNRRIPRRAGVHAADRNYAVAAMLGFSGEPMDFSITVTDAERIAASRLLAEAGFTPDEPFAVLVPATRWETKTWPAERYGILAARLARRFGLRSILVGGEGDIMLGDDAVALSAGAAVNLCGRTTLRQLAAIVQRAAVVVTADSTPMHMAAALSRPLVALFGPTNPDRTGPYGRMEDVVKVDLACSPCYLRRLRQCPHHHACMQKLDVGIVEHAVAERLGHVNDAIVEEPSR